MNPVTSSRIHLIRWRTERRHGTSPHSFISPTTRKSCSGRRRNRYSSRVEPRFKRTNHLSRRGEKEKKISFLSHLLFLRSHHRVTVWRRCNGFPGKTSEGREMFLRIKIRKKNQVAVNFLVYRFPVNKYFNVPLTRGLTDPVYFSHPLFFNYNFITDSFAEIFYNFSLLFFFIEISIENLSIYSFVLILKVCLEATFIRVFWIFRIILR